MGKLNNLEPVIRTYSCRIAILMTELDAEDQNILNNALDNTNEWPANTLSKALKTRGIQLADTTITKHREKRCSC